MQYKRKMGIDYGEVRIGIALSDLLCIISSPYEVYVRKDEQQDLLYLSNLIKEQDVDLVVFGLPLNMDGTEGDRAVKTREFASKLENMSNVKIVFYDERLTSVEAEEILIQSGVRREKRRQMLDKIAAQIILQDYLKSKN